MRVRTNDKMKILLFADSMSKTQTQSVNSQKAETHLSAREQLICLTPFLSYTLTVFAGVCISIELSEIEPEHFKLRNLGGLSYSRWSFYMKIKKIPSSLNRLITCEHSTFPLPTDGGT